MNLPALGSGQPRCYLYDSPQGGRAGKLHPCFRYTSGSLGIRTLPRAKRKLTKQKAVPTTFIKKKLLARAVYFTFVFTRKENTSWA